MTHILRKKNSHSKQKEENNKDDQLILKHIKGRKNLGRTESWFFEKINEIGKPVAGATMREGKQPAAKSGMEDGITTGSSQ